MRPENEDDRNRYGRWHYLLFLALLRGGITLAVNRSGVLALSDDDYARVTIAQRFAAHPRFDPSGSSWLPFPFWVLGGALRVFDTTLETARSVNGCFAILATWLLFAAGRSLGFTNRRAFWWAALANVVPATAVLGSMTVPEYPTAALSLFALVVVSRPGGAFWAGMAMLAATLSRYEAWPVAVVVAVFAAWGPGRAAGWKRPVLGVVPLAGPTLWIVHNAIAYGDALSFLHRVSHFRSALGLSSRGYGGAYWLGLVGGSPAVAFAATAIVFLVLRRKGDREFDAGRYLSWGAGAVALLVFLVVGDFLGGAPTHHPERALLLIWLLATLLVIDLLRVRPLPRWFAAPVVALAMLDLQRQVADPGASRSNEELAGVQLRALVGPAERVFIATQDYGYFAIMAAFGRPFDAAIDRTHDPREKNELSLVSDGPNLALRLKAEKATWLVAPSGSVYQRGIGLRSRLGDLTIFEVEGTR